MRRQEEGTCVEQPTGLVYFICTGNSARSQMAEGFFNALAGSRLRAESGGLEPSVVNPLAIAVMAEVGVDLSAHHSKPIDPARLNAADIVVTLCGDAEERCPVTPAHVRRLHWPLADPARASGSAEERLQVFRTVRDQIRERVTELLTEGVAPA